jgi:glycosyltransferase involved in cell wall biosynthesis
MSHLAVSVIIPTYNRARLVVRSVRSVLAATSPGDEVIVVDDGSTDGTEQELASAFGARIRFVRGEHKGAGAARNAGLRAATNPLVAFQDSDDEWMPDKLYLQRAVILARPEVVYCFTDFGLREEGGPEEHGGLVRWHRDQRPWDQILGPGIPFSTIGSLPPGREPFDVHVGDLYAGLMERLYVPTNAFLVRRELAGDALWLAEHLAGGFEDWECFARLARRGPVAYLDCETVWQYGHSGPRLTGDDVYRKLLSRIEMLRTLWGSDQQFLARHGGRYQKVLADHHLMRAQVLIARGQSREARQALREAGRAPLSYRAAASLPPPVLRGLLRLRRLLGRVRSAWSGGRDRASPSLIGGGSEA